MGTLGARSLPGIREVRAGDDIGTLIAAALEPGELRSEQLVAIAHTIVSKAEGAVRELAAVEPGPRARELGAVGGRDPRLMQVVLEESAEVIRSERGVLIARTRSGLVCANAGVDSSNAGPGDVVLLLPRDPDASARAIRARLHELTGARPAVMITDTFGRPWRLGQTDVAIGLAGIQPLDDWRGRSDADGRRLQATMPALADAAAAAADLARAKDSREPVVLIDGLAPFIGAEDGPGAAALLRPREEDLFL